MRPDVTIIGAGMAGLHAACPLVEAGVNVLMLDAGEEPRNKFGFGYPLLGYRARYARLRTEHGKRIIESFVAGGLSEIWGGVCERFDAEELQAAGLPNLDEDYDIVSKRIGLSGTFVHYKGHTTLGELKQYPNFKYRKNFVTEIPLDAGIVIVACGAVNTAKLLGSRATFYKGNQLYFCLSSQRLPFGGLHPVSAFPLGASYVLLYSLFPFTSIVDLRGPQVDLRSQGMWPFFHLTFPDGNASHYGGGVKVDKHGKYREGVYVADAAGWQSLPAKPIALTIMANANRIGRYIRDTLSARSVSALHSPS
jgi:NAD(P)-binding Rossmann-like domain